MLNDRKGHELHVSRTAEGNYVFFCVKCGAFCTAKPIKLARACPNAISPYGQRSLDRIDRKVHPDPKVNVAINDTTIVPGDIVF